MQGSAATRLAACSLASTLLWRPVRRSSSYKAATTICAEEAPLILSPGTWEAILARLRARQIRAVLCVFYDQPWDDVIAKRNGAVFVASSVCYDSASRGFDGLHMNANGHRVVAARLLPVVEKLVAARKRGPGTE